MKIAEATAFINSFTRSGAPVTDLSRISGLLEQLGDPQKALQFVHIAGTNGKGSVAEYLTCILLESGYRTGTFTSPHNRHYRDRIRLNGGEIPEEALCRYCEQVAAVCGDVPYSQFEITLAVALLFFAAERTQLVVLETGIGGLLDATNCIDPPLAAVITSISMDHRQLLGDTVEEIARQKAGIIKSGSTAVLAPQKRTSVLDILTAAAGERGCPVYPVAAEDCEVTECGISGNRFRLGETEYTTRMGGRHQIDNALTALRTVQVLRDKGFDLPEAAVQRGLAEAQVPGRLQVLRRDPLVLLDGGHNAGGVGALTDLLSESGISSWIGICGMTDGKDADAAAFQLALVLTKVLCVDGFAEQALPAEQLRDAFVRQHAMASPMPLGEALPYALRWAQGSHGAVVICGSLYLTSWYLNREE